MKTRWMSLVSAAVWVLALAAVRGAAQTVPISETYTWSGELVALDAGSRIITVKAPGTGNGALADLSNLKAGERIVLKWSGYDSYANGIMRAGRPDPAKTRREPFTFAVDFVAYEPARDYLTFKFPIPATSIEALVSLQPGEWVTVTSRHQPAGDAEAIAAVRPYTVTDRVSN